MRPQIESSFVRIRNSSGDTAGAGFLADERHVVTCAHVVDDALGRKRNTYPLPATLIPLDLPFVKPGSIYHARVIVWQLLDASGKGDIAVLELMEPPELPHATDRCRLVLTDDVMGHVCYAFGYPEHYEGVGRWSAGILIRRNAFGWIQIENKEAQKHFVTKGFSGGPVWDEQVQGIVGIVVAADPRVEVSAMIPTAMLLAAWPDLRCAERTGNLHNVPQAPPHYLARSDPHAALTKLVIGEGAGGGISPARRVTVLHGMGGIGKTVVAAAFARSREVREAFSDGILWITIGQEPAVPERLALIGQILDGDPSKYTTYAAAKARLAAVLSERRCLFILDDVWDVTHVDVFMDILGERCRMLVTSRDSTLATNLDAFQFRLDVLGEEATAMLLAEWSAIPPHALPDDARLVANECGNLPFALALCGAMVRDGALWSDLLEALRAADLTYLERQFPGYPYPNLLRALKVSIDTLYAADFENYKKLVVFPKGAEVPEETVLLFWLHAGQMTARGARKLLSDLDRKALIRLTGESPNRRIGLHDLHHDYLLAALAEQTGLHIEILAAYQAKCPDGWYSGPDDGYFFDYLAYHLIQAGKRLELLATVKDLRYIARKTHLRNSLAVQTDLELAEKHNPDSPVLSDLRKSFVNAAHLLNECDTLNDVAATFLARIQHIAALRPYTGALERIIVPPYFITWRPLPDITHPALVRTIEAHDSFVWSCGLDPAGRRAVSASEDGSLKVWDLYTGARLFVLNAHTGAVFDCAFSPNGRHILSCSADHSLVLWDAQSGARLRTLDGHEGAVNACAFGPDSSFAVSGSEDKTLIIWDLDEGAPQSVLAGHGDAVTDCAISPDGSRAVSTSRDGTMRVWDLKTQSLVVTMEVGRATACSIGIDSRMIACVTEDGTVTLWDATTGRSLQAWPAHRQPVSRCSISSDGVSLVTCAGRRNVIGDSAGGGQLDPADHTIKLWELEGGRLLQTYVGHSRKVTDCQITRDGRLIVSSSRDGTLRVWDALSRETYEPQKGHVDWIHGCAVSRNGDFAATASDDSSVCIWSATSGELKRVLLGHTADVNDVAISGDSTVLVSCSRDGTAKVWDAITGVELQTLRGQGDALSGCAISPDGRNIATTSYDGMVCVWDRETSSLLRALAGHENKVRGCAFTPSGRHLISASEDCTVRVWDLAEGREDKVLRGHTNRVSRVTVSQDGRRLVSASDDHTMRVWDLVTGEALRTILGHSGPVRGCSLISDDRLLLSASMDGSVRLWDLASTSCVATLYLDDVILNCAGYPNDRHVIAVGARGVYFLRIAG